MLQIIARVTSGAIQKDPAKLGIGELIAALQSSFADHCEGLEVGECVAVFGQAAVAEVPAALPCGLLQAVDRVQEAATGFEFRGSGVAAQDTAEDGRNTVFTGCCRQAGNFGRLIQHKRIVQVEQGLLGNGGLVSAWCMSIGAGKVEGAKETGQVLSIDAGIDRPSCDIGVSGQIG